MIVIEASAVVDALIGDAVSPDLLAQLADEDLHAPALLDYEVASAIRGHLMADRVSPRRARDAADDFCALTIERHGLARMMPSVLDLRDDLTAYDAAYVVLALALGAPLVTVDTKLAEVRRLGVDVRILRAEP